MPTEEKQKQKQKEREKKANELFRDWSETVARAAMHNQDKTFRELVDKRIINSWAEYVIKNKYP